MGWRKDCLTKEEERGGQEDRGVGKAEKPISHKKLIMDDSGPLDSWEGAQLGG